ncbi:MAG: hypothetical protein F4190_02105 [Acidimicrobiales bacterium]|nr:hypothetical protein [Acidimicrobiales bacterium]MYG87309.1 hypothetical protein [Acidimicrobiales bacterium]MYI28048.1 hypothetical protein [Acidimicrobiales bacterium]
MAAVDYWGKQGRQLPAAVERLTGRIEHIAEDRGQVCPDWFRDDAGDNGKRRVVRALEAGAPLSAMPPTVSR